MDHLMNLAVEVCQHFRERESVNLGKNGFVLSCLKPLKNCRFRYFYYVCNQLIEK